MSSYHPAVDAYLAAASGFARPILEKLRALVHEAVPDVTEEIKWGRPCFLHHGILCGFAAFKAHAVFYFWKGQLLHDPQGHLGLTENEALGSLGKMKSMSDLPPDAVILGFARQAAALNEQGIALPKAKPAKKPEAAIPTDLQAALDAAPASLAAFRAFAPSHRREYINWINEAKTPPTRERRIAQCVEWVGAGRQRDWRYQQPKRERPERGSV